MQWHVNFEVGMMTCRCFTTVNHCCTPPRKQWSFHIQVELKLVREVNERVGGFFYELLFVVLIRIDGLILGFPLCFWKVKVYTCTCSILITDTTWLQPDRTEPNTGGKVVLLGFSNVRLSLLLFSLEAKTEDWPLKVQNQENKGSDSAVARWKRWYWCLLINYWRSNVNPLLKINC